MTRSSLPVRVYFVCALATIVIAALVFWPKGDSAPTESNLKARFRAVSPGLPPPLPTIRDVDIYIDGSQSMAGYVRGSGRSYYETMVRTLLKGVTTGNGYTHKIWKVSEKLEEVTQQNESEFFSEGFYNGKDSPLRSLIDRITKQSPLKLSVIISDMVLSERGTDQRLLVEALRSAAKVFPQIQLVGMRSQFWGKYWVEARPAAVPVLQLQASQAEPRSGRPFYILYLAPSEKTLQTFNANTIDALDAELCQKQTVSENKFCFNPAFPPIELSSSVGLPAGQGWRIQQKSRTKPEESLHPTFYSAYTAEGPATQDPAIPVLADGGKRSSFVGTPRLAITYWKEGGLGEPKTREVPLKIGEKQGATTIAFPLPVDAPNARWTSYYMQVRAGEGSLVVPDWLAEWSTEDDRLERFAPKTFQLAYLVEAMLRGITANALISEHYVTVGRQ